MSVKIICAWCGKVMREEGEEKGWRVGQDGESHGICPECVKEQFGPQIAKKIEAKAFEIDIMEQRNDGNLSRS